MTRMLGRALDKAVLGECFTFAPSIQRATRGTDETTSHSTMLPEDISQVAGYQDGREMYRTTVEIIQHYLVSKRCTPTLIGLMLALVLINDSSALGDEAGQQWLTSHCGQCHGLSTDNKCVAGNCSGGRVHAVIPRAWDMVVPVMRSLGCTMTDAEEKSVTEYLMSNYGKSYPMQWARSGTIPGGWNVVAMGTFKRRLYAGIEGNGSLFELGDDAAWKKALVTLQAKGGGGIADQGWRVRL